MVGAEGIMTTDTHPKALSASIGTATITWVAKGSGMIEPNMATMLSYIFTDAAFDAPTLDRLLRAAVAPTFNMLSVDTDTSTSDTCAILANGLAGTVDEAEFLAVLTAGCRRMTEILARDGEGAEHLVRVTVRRALNATEAHVVAKSILNSPLVKTMVHGADPNVGRLLMAVGKCFDCTIRPATTDAWINGFQVVGHGERLAFDDAVVRETLSREVVDLSVVTRRRRGRGGGVRLRPHQGLRRRERQLLQQLSGGGNGNYKSNSGNTESTDFTKYTDKQRAPSARGTLARGGAWCSARSRTRAESVVLRSTGGRGK